MDALGSGGSDTVDADAVIATNKPINEVLRVTLTLKD